MTEQKFLQDLDKKLWTPNIKIISYTITTFALLFYLWQQSYTYHCMALVFPIIMLAIIGWGYAELTMNERKCFSEFYIINTTFLSKLLSRRFFVLLFYTISSMAMTVAAFMISINFPLLLWVYFIVHIILSLVLFRYITHLFSKIIHENYITLFAKEWSIRVMAIILVVVYIFISLNEYTPIYLSESLQQTVTNATSSVFSNCNVIQIIMQYGKSIDSSFWWIVVESTEQMNDSLIKAGVWIIFLLYNSLALLGINRLILQTIYYLDREFNTQ